MSKVFTNNGNKALDNIALFKYIRDLDLRIHSKKTANGKVTSKTAMKAVLFTLATYRNNTTGQCNPDMRTIGENSGCSRDTVSRSISELINRKVLIKINMGYTGSNTRNRYYFAYDMKDLKDMFEDCDHEIHKSSELEPVEEAIYQYKTHVLP